MIKNCLLYFFASFLTFYVVFVHLSCARWSIDRVSHACTSFNPHTCTPFAVSMLGLWADEAVYFSLKLNERHPLFTYILLSAPVQLSPMQNTTCKDKLPFATMETDENKESYFERRLAASIKEGHPLGRLVIWIVYKLNQIKFWGLPGVAIWTDGNDMFMINILHINKCCCSSIWLDLCLFECALLLQINNDIYEECFGNI